LIEFIPFHRGAARTSTFEPLWGLFGALAGSGKGALGSIPDASAGDLQRVLNFRSD
jgi:hypothetical protein